MSRRQRVYRTEVIVLRRTDFGEADRLLTVLTPERGKLRLVAKGVRKPTSRKSGHVELFSYGQFLVAMGRDLDIVTQAETLEPFLALREDLMRTTYAYYMAELADAFSAERDENQPLFDLLKDALGWLCEIDTGANGSSDQGLARALPLLARYYELHLLALAGYQPQLFVCGGCKKQLEPETNYLSAPGGGVYCRRCGFDRVGASELSVNALKVLRFLQTCDWETCQWLRLSPATLAETERVLHHYITYHLERSLKTVDFIHRLRRQMGAVQVQKTGETS
jgi:DNA repair protein RecO (recombination protein O)